MSVSMTINQGTPSQIDGIPWTQGMNVQTAMERAYGVTRYIFWLQYFGTSLGYAVVNLNGVAQQPGNGMYWFLYINGNEATAGIDSVILDDGDQIGWQFNHYSELTDDDAKDRAHSFYTARKSHGEL